MTTNLAPILRDTLIRFQQTALRETGRRPMASLPVPDALTLPGCQKPGYAYWQPAPWEPSGVPLGEYAAQFHPSIVNYLSMCQFLEMRFCLPVVRKGSALSFLYNRPFETFRNTVDATPAQAFEEAVYVSRERSCPLAFCMASTCDGGEPIRLMLSASDGQAFLDGSGREPMCFRLGVDRLLPKLQFVL